VGNHFENSSIEMRKVKRRAKGQVELVNEVRQIGVFYRNKRESSLQTVIKMLIITNESRFPWLDWSKEKIAQSRSIKE
jgi:hypothetical protein